MARSPEQTAVYWIEKEYMRNKRRNIYLACTDMDFTWDEPQVYAVAEMYRRGATIYEIARYPGINRDPDEVAILIMDLARKGIIDPRERRKRDGAVHLQKG